MAHITLTPRLLVLLMVARLKASKFWADTDGQVQGGIVSLK